MSTVDKMRRLYDELLETVEDLEAKRVGLVEDLTAKQNEFDTLRKVIDEDTRNIELERSMLEQDKRQFSDFQSDALVQMESYKEKLDAQKAEFIKLKAEAKDAIESDKNILQERSMAFEVDKTEKEAELLRLSQQLDEERAEFEGYRSATQGELERNLEACDDDKRVLNEERSTFDRYREQQMENIHKDQEELDSQRKKLEESRVSQQSDLNQQRQELQAAIRSFEEDSTKLNKEIEEKRDQLDSKMGELDMHTDDMVKQKYKLNRERKLHQDKRKQLAKLLRGLGESIGENGETDVSDMDDLNTPIGDSGKEVLVYKVVDSPTASRMAPKSTPVSSPSRDYFKKSSEYVIASPRVI